MTCIGSERSREVILPFWGGFRLKNEWTGQSKLPSGSRFRLKLLQSRSRGQEVFQERDRAITL